MPKAVRPSRNLRARHAAVLCALVLVTVAVARPIGALAEQASEPGSAGAGRLDAGGNHTCAVLASAAMRCWGYGASGQLGYGNANTVGDDEAPGSIGPVDLGGGRTAVAIAAGDFHTCALIDDGSVRCWGFGANGRLGYANTESIGDNETPASVGPVDLGPGRALAIAAGSSHTCALLDDGSVRCWGFGANGRLGYANTESIGDNETPVSVGPVDLGPGRALAITAGDGYTCALLDDGSVRCWGFGGNGRLGYGNRDTIGDDESPASVGPVGLDSERKATAISTGDAHTCVVMDDGKVRCWGYGFFGQLGYGTRDTIGDDELPSSIGPVNLGPGRAVAITAGDFHACARFSDGTVRCWGFGGNGRLGYGNLSNIGDNEAPGSVGPVQLGLGRTATAISAGQSHTCARLDGGAVRCWGYGGNGRLGYCNEDSIGDDETPDSAQAVDLEMPGSCPNTGGGGGAGGGGIGGGVMGGGESTATTPGAGGAQSGRGGSVDPLALQAHRARDLRACIAKAKRAAKPKRDSARRTCLKRYGRTPGRIKGLKGAGKSKTTIVLTFSAPGTDGPRPPAARAYLVKQSPRSIGDARDFARAQALCKGSCRFKVTRVGTKITLTVTDLLPKTTYYFAIAARDNVSGRLGPRSTPVKAQTR